MVYVNVLNIIHYLYAYLMSFVCGLCQCSQYNPLFVCVFDVFCVCGLCQCSQYNPLFVCVYDVFCVRFMSMFSIVYFECVNRNRKDGLSEYILLIL